MVRFLRRAYARGKWHLLSVPIYFKVAGIGVVVATVFGVVTLFVLQRGLERFVETESQARARSIARTIEMRGHVGEAIAPGGVDRLRSMLRRSFPDIEQVALFDEFYRPMGDSEPLPGALRNAVSRGDSSGTAYVASTSGLHAQNVLLQLEGTDAAWLWVRLSDQSSRLARNTFTTSVLFALGMCFVIGQLLALLLTTIIIQPIRHLTAATDGIAAGDFATRASIRTPDELGRLAKRFNAMSATLEIYRSDVEKREEERRMLLNRLVNAQEDEKRSLARELHDHFGQSLSTLLLLLDSLKRDGDDHGRVINDMEEYIRLIIDDMRKLSYTLRPSILDDYGLDSAIRRYVELLQSRASFNVDYQYVSHDDNRLPEAVETALYRILQEALTNIVRHSEAKHVSIVVFHGQDEVRLVIEDNGVGFDVDAMSTDKRGLGLMTMHERTTLLLGTFSIESGRGAGTHIVLDIPLTT